MSNEKPQLIPVAANFGTPATVSAVTSTKASDPVDVVELSFDPKDDPFPRHYLPNGLMVVYSEEAEEWYKRNPAIFVHGTIHIYGLPPKSDDSKS